MKKLFLFFFANFVLQTASSQVSNSILSQGDWYKFSVDTTGVFKIDRNLLQQIGVSTNNLNPKKIHIYGNGGNLLPVLNSDFRYDDLQENAIYIEGEDDGVFNTNDFILFYAKGPHDWEVNTTNETATHRQNIFSDKAYYFITVNDIDGKRIQQKTPVTGSATLQLTTFDDFIFYEKEEVNLFAVGTQWFGEDFSIENTQDFTIPFPNALANTDISVKVRGVSTSTTPSSMSVNVNAQNIYTLNFSSVNPSGLTKANPAERTASIENSANSIAISITYDNAGNPSAKTYLDFIEIVGKKQLIATDKQFSFRSFQQANTTGVVEYQVQNASTIFQIWDVSNSIEPKNIANESAGNDFNFKDDAGSLKEYIALNQTDFYIPETVENSKIINQNVHAIKDINYLIITNQELSSQAQRLADYHQTNSNLTTQVVLVDEIYNEFSSGSKDITGIRDFINHVYTTNSSPDKKLKYVCFFGDSSYDYKDRIAGNNNIVPVKLAPSSFNLATSWVTDDFFVMLDDNEGTMLASHTIDVISSRIPVSTLQQAQDVVDKILSYYQRTAIGDWRNTITLLADDIDANSDIQIQSGVEIVADEIKNNKPIFNVHKIYADSYVQENSSGGERYPQVNKAITNAIEKGTLVFDYFGHGGEDGFASERILEKPQIPRF
ncbi:MAG: type IX secretion system sortase PorU [Polaribacter sp.]